VPSWLDAVPLEPIGQRRGVAEAEELGGAGLVAAGGFHGLLQIVSRDAVDDAIEINPVADIPTKDGVFRLLWGRAWEQGITGIFDINNRPEPADQSAIHAWMIPVSARSPQNASFAIVRLDISLLSDRECRIR